MQPERLSGTLYLAIVFLLLYLFYKILNPFLTTIAWAMVLSIIFYPLHRLFLRFVKRPWLSSLVTLIAIMIIIAGPFSFIIFSLAREIKEVYSMIEAQGIENIMNLEIHPRLEEFTLKLSSYKIFQEFNLQESIVRNLKSVGEYIVKNVSDVFRNAVLLLVNLIILCLTIFYFLKDGEILTKYLRQLLPFPDRQKQRLVERVKETVIAAVYGGLVVGIAQGTLGGIAFMFLGLSSPVFWGTVMALFSFVPLFGTFLIWMPAAVMLILSASYVKGIGLLLYGALIISGVDNVLKPLIIGGRTRMHTLLVFFSVLGGIKFFGLLGFILGPLIAALCLSLFETYAEES